MKGLSLHRILQCDRFVLAVWQCTLGNSASVSQSRFTHKGKGNGMLFFLLLCDAETRDNECVGQAHVILLSERRNVMNIFESWAEPLRIASHYGVTCHNK
jgi:hypothetical protein